MQNKEKIEYLLNLLKNQSKDFEEIDIFENLLEIRINNVSNCLNKNTQYNEKAVKIYSLYEKIEKVIRDKKIIELLDDWMCLISENNEISNELFYKLGAKDGINIAIALLEEE